MTSVQVPRFELIKLNEKVYALWVSALGALNAVARSLYYTVIELKQWKKPITTQPFTVRYLIRVLNYQVDSIYRLRSVYFCFTLCAGAVSCEWGRNSEIHTILNGVCLARGASNLHNWIVQRTQMNVKRQNKARKCRACSREYIPHHMPQAQRQEREGNR